MYIKGVFYIQLLESVNIASINAYLASLNDNLNKKPTLVNVIRIVHQSYENVQAYFKGVDCDNNPQAGPILT